MIVVREKKIPHCRRNMQLNLNLKYTNHANNYSVVIA